MSPKVDSAAMVDLSGDVASEVLKACVKLRSSNDIKKTLELTTYFLASEIANHLLLKKLEIMSSIDSLSGIKNRNEMNIHVDQIVGRKLPTPDAVFFIDLNGLKRVNDENTDNYFITKNSSMRSL